MIIAVGSTNKTKIDPVNEVFSKHFKNVKVVGVKVASGGLKLPDKVINKILKENKNLEEAVVLPWSRLLLLLDFYTAICIDELADLPVFGNTIFSKNSGHEI